MSSAESKKSDAVQSNSLNTSTQDQSENTRNSKRRPLPTDPLFSQTAAWWWPLGQTSERVRQYVLDTLLKPNMFTPDFDRNEFATLLAWSLSLSKGEKLKVLAKFNELSEYQLSELRVVFIEERDEFWKLLDKECEYIVELFHKCSLDWAQLVLSFQGIESSWEPYSKSMNGIPRKEWKDPDLSHDRLAELVYLDMVMASTRGGTSAFPYIENRDEYWAACARALRAKGYFEDAKAAFVKALESDPTAPSNWIDIARILHFKLHRPAEAIRYYATAMALPGTKIESIRYAHAVAHFESNLLDDLHHILKSCVSSIEHRERIGWQFLAFTAFADANMSYSILEGIDQEYLESTSPYNRLVYWSNFYIIDVCTGKIDAAKERGAKAVGIGNKIMENRGGDASDAASICLPIAMTLGDEASKALAREVIEQSDNQSSKVLFIKLIDYAFREETFSRQQIVTIGKSIENNYHIFDLIETCYILAWFYPGKSKMFSRLAKALVTMKTPNAHGIPVGKYKSILARYGNFFSGKSIGAGDPIDIPLFHQPKPVS